MPRNQMNRDYNGGRNTNRNARNYQGSGRNSDERDYDFGTATDRDFDLGGGRRTRDWGSNRMSNENFSMGEDFDRDTNWGMNDDREMRSRSGFDRNFDRDYDRHSRGNWGGQRRQFNRQSEFGSYGGSEGSGFGENFGRADYTGYRHQGRTEDRGFFNRGPKGWKRSDERIKEDVCEALSDSYSVDASDIEVSVKEGDVTLRGNVDNRFAKLEAERCIENIRGVNDVHNEIRVRRNEGMTQMKSGSSDTSGRSTNLS